MPRLHQKSKRKSLVSVFCLAACAEAGSLRQLVTVPLAVAAVGGGLLPRACI